jgi:PIN domain nuclease of toxin-antitoxin system
MEAESSRLFVSIASLWEMAIKMSLKKLMLSVDFATMVEKTRENGFELLPVEPEHLVALMSLEYIHRDPFDRLIIAHALTENMPLISSDDVFDRYPVKREWV